MALSDTRVRVGVVGTGRWGRNLARNFHGIGCLAGLCDSASEALRIAARACPSVPGHDSANELISSGNVDAVAIATPAGTHHDIAASALAAGLHVFVEKPMTTDLAAAKALVADARCSGLQLVTGHLLHYHPAFQSLLSLVRSDRLGALHSIVTSRLIPGPEVPREHVLWEFAPHDVAMILACAGALPSSVRCSGADPRSDGSAAVQCSIELRFRTGLRTQTTVSWRSDSKVQRFEVHGETGSAVFDDVAPAEAKLKLTPAGQPPCAIRFPEQEPLAAECAAFVEAVKTGVAPVSGASEGLRVMTVLDACFRSLNEKRTVLLQTPENG